VQIKLDLTDEIYITVRLFVMTKIETHGNLLPTSAHNVIYSGNACALLYRRFLKEVAEKDTKHCINTTTILFWLNKNTYKTNFLV
jgi:hypothetical protein